MSRDVRHVAVAKTRKRPDKAGQRSSQPSTELGRGQAVALALVAFVGGAVSLYLTHVRHQLLGGAEGDPLCVVGAGFDCRSILTSPYSSIGGLPLSVVAMWFYGVTFAVAFMGIGRARGGLPRSPAIVLAVLYALGSAISAILAAVSIPVLGAFCALCASLYAVNGIGLVVAARALRDTGETFTQAIAREPRYWWTRPRRALLVGALVFAPLAAIVAMSRGVPRESGLCEAVAAASPEAPLSLVVFSDFQCPHCRTLHRALRSVPDNPRIRFILRHYPLDAACNPHVAAGGHRGACLQARAAICADQQGHLSDYADRLFDESSGDEGRLLMLARASGLDPSALSACLNSASTSEVLTADIEAAMAKGVTATPSIFLDGRELSRQLSPTDIYCLTSDRVD